MSVAVPAASAAPRRRPGGSSASTRSADEPAHHELHLTDAERARLAAAVQAYARTLLRNGEPIDAALERIRRKIVSPQRHDGGQTETGGRQWSTTREAAEALGVSQRTVQRRIRRGTLQQIIREA